MNNDDFDSVDETLRRKFEAAWIKGPAPVIADFLPDSSQSSFLGTLEELVHIDMEFRWKAVHDALHEPKVGAQKPPKAVRPTVESYVQRFPELMELPILQRLVEAEFELRFQYQDQPRPQEYAKRFPALSQLGVDWQKLLQPPTQLDRGPSPAKPGEVWGRYKLVAEHGKGGFGAVWRADDTRINRRIALKQLSDHLSRQSEFRRRFEKEARITAQLEHPGIVPIYDISNVDEDHAYYTMKLVRGRTMAETIQRIHELEPRNRKRAIENRRLLQSFIDVCHTIEYCHSRAILHRDLKPQNVVLGDYGETILLDWGLAAPLDQLDQPTSESAGPLDADDPVISRQDSLQTMRGAIQGTPAYMPPEQARGEVKRVGAHSDIYSLGAMLYHILTGRAPFTDGDTSEFWQRVKQSLLTPPSKLTAHVPRPLEAICLKAMSARPEDRYAAVEHLSRDLQNFLADEPVRAFPEPLHVRLARWMRKHTALTTAAVLIVLFLSLSAVVGVVVTQNAREQEWIRISALRTAAERAEASAISQVQSDQFQAARRFLEQALQIVQNEPVLRDLSDRIENQHEAISSIVDFYRWGQRAQEHLFFDRLRETTIYSQAALQRIGALRHPDWWNHLPIQDLRPIQVQRMRQEIYRQLGIMSTIRLAESASEGFSLAWLMGLKSDGVQQPDQKLKSAAFAARQANRYRPARILQFVGSVGTPEFSLRIGQPLNPTDAAMLGSIMTTHVPSDAAGQLLVQVATGIIKPQETAKRWLLDALTDTPEWYWLSIFIGSNEMLTGQLEQSVRSFSHAVGVNPDGWVGYFYRAIADTRQAQAASDTTQRNTLLRRAALDLQRARDLGKANSILFWSEGYLQSQTNENPRIAARTFLEALTRHPRVDQIPGGYFGNVTNLLLSAAREHTENGLKTFPADIDLLLLKGAIKLWQGEYAAALPPIELVLNLNADHPIAQGLLGVQMALASGKSVPEQSIALMSRSLATQPSWHVALELARVLLERGDLQASASRLDQAEHLSQTPWQSSTVRIWKTLCYMKKGNQQMALEMFQQAVENDLAVDLAALHELVEQYPESAVAQAVSVHSSRVSPYAGSDLDDAKFISSPALINGGFELGLSYAWGDVHQASSAGIWINHGECSSTVEVSDQQAHSGASSLHIVNPSMAQPGRFGDMVQTIPVTPGVTYQVSLWCRSARAEEGSLLVALDGSPQDSILSIPSGTYPWQRVSGVFTAQSDQAGIRVVTRNQCDMWIDDLQIQAIR